MKSDALEGERVRLARRLERLSAALWVREVDRLSRFHLDVDEAIVLLGGRFAGDYLDSRRTIIWSMIEYVHIRFELEASRESAGEAEPAGKARSGRDAAA